MSATIQPPNGSPAAPGALPPGLPIPAPIGAIGTTMTSPLALAGAHNGPVRIQAPDNPLRRLLERWSKMPNIAEDEEEIDAQELDSLALRVSREYDIDENSRADWKEKYKRWLDFAMQVAEEKTYPWPNACYSLDTDILTETGWKPVGSVAVGERVYSRGPDGSAAYHPVSAVHRHTAMQMVHFDGKSIDLLVTPNHRMLVESKFGKRKKQHFIEAQRFVDEPLAWRYIPLTSSWRGHHADTVHGIDARAYVRFLGWFVSEGSNFRARNVHQRVNGDIVDYGLSTSSFAIAQSIEANGEKFAQIRRDIDACGFSCSSNDKGFIVHARSMPQSMKDELRGLGTCEEKHIPDHVMFLSSRLLRELLDTLMMGDGHARLRPGKNQEAWAYATTSRRLAGQIQEIAQKIGLRATVAETEPEDGGSIKGRQITGALRQFVVNINRKARIQVVKMSRRLVSVPQDVACVTVEPHHTVFVRRNGKAVWCGNSNVIYPLITVAALQFSARSYPAIIRDRNVVKGVVIGPDEGELLKGPQGEPVITSQGPHVLAQPGEKQDRADRIGAHMSWQLLDEQEEWEPQTDRLLIVLPIVGCMFRKSYFDPSMGRNVSETVDGLRFCVNYRAKSFETAPRYTEIIPMYPWEIETAIRSELFLDEDYGHDTMASEDAADKQDDDAPTTFLEQHRRYDLDGDGYAEPYIVTISRDGHKMARIRAAYDMDCIEWTASGRVKKITPIPYYTPYGFIPNPESGVYALGFGHLLYPINEAINTSLNQMFDAGHLQNAGGGFIGTGISINTGAVRFQVGEYKPVNTMGNSIRDNVFPLPFQGPSQVLFALLQFLVEAGERVAAVKDIMTGDMPGDNTSGITTLAVIEQGLQVFSSIYKRIHRSLGYEFRKLYRLNRIYLQEDGGFRANGVWTNITRADYEKGAGVEPVSDPRMVTDMQRLGRAQFLLQFKDDPMMNGLAIRSEALEAAVIPRPQRFLNQQPPPPPPQFVLKSRELDIRERREMLDLQLRAQHDRAMIMREIAQAELFLAQARKLDDDTQIAWVEQHIAALKAYVDATTGPAPAAGGDGQPAGSAGTPGPAAGAIAAAIPGVAAASGLPTGAPALPAGPAAGP